MNRFKGKFGYLKRKKVFLAIVSAFFLLGIAGLFIIGYVVSKSRVNLFSIAAVIMAIPGAMAIAQFFGIVSFKGRSKEEYDALSEIVNGGILDCELVIANKDGKSYQISYAVVAEDGIVAFTADTKADTRKAQEYIRNFLRLNEVDTPLSITNDYRVFLKQVKSKTLPVRETCDDIYLRQEGILLAISM